MGFNKTLSKVDEIDRIRSLADRVEYRLRRRHERKIVILTRLKAEVREYNDLKRLQQAPEEINLFKKMEHIVKGEKKYIDILKDALVGFEDDIQFVRREEFIHVSSLREFEEKLFNAISNLFKFFSQIFDWCECFRFIDFTNNP